MKMSSRTKATLWTSAFCVVLASTFFVLAPSRKISRDYQIAGRRCLSAIEHWKEVEYENRDVAELRVNADCSEANNHRDNEWDTKADQFLKNYATAVHYSNSLHRPSYMPSGDSLAQFCREHGCDSLYEQCKKESLMFESGVAPRNSLCRNIAAEDK
jgi:hypothetical protein